MHLVWVCNMFWTKFVFYLKGILSRWWTHIVCDPSCHIARSKRGTLWVMRSVCGFSHIQKFSRQIFPPTLRRLTVLPLFYIMSKISLTSIHYIHHSCIFICRKQGYFVSKGCWILPVLPSRVLRPVIQLLTPMKEGQYVIHCFHAGASGNVLQLAVNT